MIQNTPDTFDGFQKLIESMTPPGANVPVIDLRSEHGKFVQSMTPETHIYKSREVYMSAMDHAKHALLYSGCSSKERYTLMAHKDIEIRELKQEIETLKAYIRGHA